MQAKLNANEISLFLSLRSLTDVTAQKAMRKQLFTAIKTRLGIPAKHAIKIDAAAITSGGPAPVQRKKTGEFYELHADGKWVGWADRPVPVPAAPVQATTTSTVYPTYVQGASPRRFFSIDNGVQDVIDSESFDTGVDVLHGVVTDKQVDYNDGRGLRRTIILANNDMYAEFKANEL